MKVIYDISLLGIGHYDSVNRTGTFRVVENMAYGLALSEIDLSFCVSQSLKVLVETLDYLEFNPQLESSSLNYSKHKAVIARKLYNYNIEFNKISGSVEIFKKCVSLTNRLAEKLFSPLDDKVLSNADIFHSPCFPLTSRVKQAKKLTRFLTVYDLIPILHPHFFEHNNDEFLKRILNSLGWDDWAICISDATKNDLWNYLPNLDPSRVFVTHLAVAPDIFYPCTNSEENASIREKYNIPNAPYILSLCTLEPRKNIEHVIRCFAKLVQEEKIQDLYLVLVGTKGWSYDKIFTELANFDLAKNRIILTGYVPDEDLAALYSGALAFAFLFTKDLVFRP